jgi:hypothetical protein
MLDLGREEQNKNADEVMKKKECFLNNNLLGYTLYI